MSNMRNKIAMTRTRKRFIAGAVCPACKAEDSLMVYMEEDKEHVRCVECDYHMSEDDHTSEEPKGKAAVKRDQVIGVFKPE
ncbi:YheV family putative zinc ribbon protein [Aliidiomarina indica]|uniref:YheV family putative zinc ribbon protein n=1 Tax=Aliidiomarina indica TaxID=2749147 RepID=UPI001E4D400F|nr:YheV family putative zinc ribbon protein [Aliidiomarina indica]